MEGLEPTFRPNPPGTDATAIEKLGGFGGFNLLPGGFGGFRTCRREVFEGVNPKNNTVEGLFGRT